LWGRYVFADSCMASFNPASLDPCMFWYITLMNHVLRDVIVPATNSWPILRSQRGVRTPPLHSTNTHFQRHKKLDSDDLNSAEFDGVILSFNLQHSQYAHLVATFMHLARLFKIQAVTPKMLIYLFLHVSPAKC
jgi:hypothetical protein